MLEKIINLFPLIENDIIRSIGFRIHETDGTDEEKLLFLQSRVEQDFTEMGIALIPASFTLTDANGDKTTGISAEQYQTLCKNGTDGVLYEGIYQVFDFPDQPLLVVTPVVDGQLRFDRVLKIFPEATAPPIKQMNETLPPYYLQAYTTKEGFDLGKLINDDFFDAIRVTHNAGRYVSSLKLLLSAIDSISFLEFGDLKDRNIFIDWLQTYCDLSPLNISGEELWECRNSLLHMTNPFSRRVLRKEVAELRFYVSEKDRPEMTGDFSAKYFNLTSLRLCITTGVEAWGHSMNSQTEKRALFIERYDMIASDSRYRRINFESQEEVTASSTSS